MNPAQRIALAKRVEAFVAGGEDAELEPARGICKRLVAARVAGGAAQTRENEALVELAAAREARAKARHEADVCVELIADHLPPQPQPKTETAVKHEG